jgi:hypothetical protein
VALDRTYECHGGAAPRHGFLLPERGESPGSVKSYALIGSFIGLDCRDASVYMNAARGGLRHRGSIILGTSPKDVRSVANDVDVCECGVNRRALPACCGADDRTIQAPLKLAETQMA